MEKFLVQVEPAPTPPTKAELADVALRAAGSLIGFLGNGQLPFHVKASAYAEYRKALAEYEEAPTLPPLCEAAANYIAHFEESTVPEDVEAAKVAYHNIKMEWEERPCLNVQSK